MKYVVQKLHFKIDTKVKVIYSRASLVRYPYKC